MKKKYFFGIFICLVLLCSGVFLLATNSFKANNQILINNQLSADNATITVEIDNVYGLGRQHISGATLNITVGIEKTSRPEEDSRTGSTFDLSTRPGSSNSGTVDASGWMWYDPFIIINSITINSNGKDGDSKIIADGSVICYSTSSYYDDGYVVYKPGCTIRLSSRASLSKRFILDIYWKIEYNCKYNDGTNNSTTAYYSTYDTDLTSSVTLPTREGYTFKGYYTEKSGGDQWITENGSVNTAKLHRSSARPRTLYAHWTPKTYRIDTNILSPSNVQDYNSGTMTQIYIGQTRTGLTDQAFSAIEADTTLTIADIEPATGMYVNSITVDRGTVSPYISYGRLGCTYTVIPSVLGNPRGNGNWDAIISINMDWLLYKVRYNANGGSGTMTDQSFTYNTAQNLKSNTFKRAGYYFTGWNGNGTNYTNGQSVINLTTTHNSTIDFDQPHYYT